MARNKINYNLLVILGPTASGKTRLGVQLADFLNGEIISADSRQVYRGLTIGSGKDLDEYRLDHQSIPYHLIDITEINIEYSVFHFQQHCFESISQIWMKNKLPLLVGGSGLYLESALKKTTLLAVPKNEALRQELNNYSESQLQSILINLKPNQHNQTDLIDRQRLLRAIEIAEYEKRHCPEPAPPIQPFILGTRWDRAILRKRIMTRLRERLQAGLIEEVEALHNNNISWERLDQLGLEYRFGAAYLQNRYTSKDEMVEKLYFAICDFAKRQLAWFRRMERQGQQIIWIDEANLYQAKQELAKIQWKVD